MKWLSNLFAPKEITEVVCVGAETEAQSLELGIRLLDEKYPDDEYEETKEKEFYCGLCRGWVPVSQFRTHGH